MSLSDSKLDIPNYRIIRHLGAGSMGVVYEAEQVNPGRRVAIKLLGELDDDPEIAARFRREAEIIAKLQHPNIVQVYQIGKAKKRPFLVLEYLGGGSLADRFLDQDFELTKAIGWIADIARGIHHAHTLNIVHRDLKPENVMFSETGIPKIMDFGLARFVGMGSAMTRKGQVIGTPAFMSPEQATAADPNVGPATDIYPLGVMIYEILTHRLPFLGDTPLEMVQSMLSESPVPPRRINPNLSHDLQAICLKCLEKKPEDRYDTALSLAEDLDHYLCDEAVSVRDAPLWEKLMRSLRRLIPGRRKLR